MKKTLEKFRSWEACCGCFRDGGANGTGNAGGLQEGKRLFSNSQEGNETRPYKPKELNLANNQNAPGSRFISREEDRPIDALILAFYETLSRGFVWATLHHNFSPWKCERINGCWMPLGLWWCFTTALENPYMYSILKSGMHFTLTVRLSLAGHISSFW